MEKFDLIAIGGGTAGLVTAAGSAGIGARVALIERERLGGECLWNGCVPSKALIAAARATADVRRSGQYGVIASGAETDFAAVMQWVRSAQQGIAPHDSPELFRGLGIDVIEGEARFIGERTLSVGSQTLVGKRVVIATGSAPAIPQIPGLADVPYLTNETVFSLSELPATLLIVGGGPIGLELGQAFARLGSTVHIIEAAPQLLVHEDPELVEILRQRLKAEGVNLHVGASVSSVGRSPAGPGIHLTASVPGAPPAARPLQLEGDALLVATGRAPRVDTLDLARAGVEWGDGGITVDGTLRTTAEKVWAAGDCVGPLRFTHVADYQARLVIRNAFFSFPREADYSVVPWVTFTDPELAHVGLTEVQARDRYGSKVRIFRRPFAEVDRAIIEGRTHGMVKLVTTNRGRILGAHILGHGAGDMIGEITLAMKHGISATQLGNTVHPYPTFPEAIRHAAEQYTWSRFTGPVKTVVGWLVRR